MNNKKKNEVRPTFPITVCTCLTTSATTGLNRQPIPPLSVSVPTVPLKRMSEHGLTAILPRVLRSWR